MVELWTELGAEHFSSLTQYWHITAKPCCAKYCKSRGQVIKSMVKYIYLSLSKCMCGAELPGQWLTRGQCCFECITLFPGSYLLSSKGKGGCWAHPSLSIEWAVRARRLKLNGHFYCCCRCSLLFAAIHKKAADTSCFPAWWVVWRPISDTQIKWRRGHTGDQMKWPELQQRFCKVNELIHGSTKH